MKISCGNECLHCSIQPLSEHEERMVRHTLRNSAHSTTREKAERILNRTIVRVYCIQRGQVLWFTVESPS